MKIPVFCIPQAAYYVYGMQRLIDSTIKLTLVIVLRLISYPNPQSLMGLVKHQFISSSD